MMTKIITFTLREPLKLPNRRGIPQNRNAGAAILKKERAFLSQEIWALLGGRLPKEAFSYAQVKVFRHSLQEPDTDNLYASCKALLDVLQPVAKNRVYGLGIIENDKPSRCDLIVRHVRARKKDDQCTRVVITQLESAPESEPELETA